jgi:hypothetical protein
MNTFHHAAVAVIMACSTLLVQAQGYKCKQTDGSISYQDHACAAGTASSSALRSDLGGAQTLRDSLPPSGSLDANCEQSARHALSVCFAGTDATLKNCQAAKMSPACRTQMSTPGVRPDTACASQAMTCLGGAQRLAQACMEREIPAACRQKIEAYRRNRLR